MTRWIYVDHPKSPNIIEESRPYQECPHCGEYRFRKIHKKIYEGLFFRTLKKNTIYKECEHCAYREENPFDRKNEDEKGTENKNPLDESNHPEKPIYRTEPGKTIYPIYKNGEETDIELVEEEDKKYYRIKD